MSQVQRIPTLHPNYNDHTSYLLNELRQVNTTLLARIEAMHQRLQALEAWVQAEYPRHD